MVVVELDDIADIAESMEEFRGVLLTRSARTADGPAMAEAWPEEEPGEGCCISPVIELLRTFEDFGLDDDSGLIFNMRKLAWCLGSVLPSGACGVCGERQHA